jgi:hypothetical protein
MAAEDVGVAAETAAGTAVEGAAAAQGPAEGAAEAGVAAMHLQDRWAWAAAQVCWHMMHMGNYLGGLSHWRMQCFNPSWLSQHEQRPQCAD